PISVTTSSGPGGHIYLNAAANGANPGLLTIPSGTMSVDAHGGGTNNGGSIFLRGGGISITGGTVTLSAQPTGSGIAGSITIETTNSHSAAQSGDITLGSGGFSIAAGGEFTVVAGGNLNIASNLVSTNGNPLILLAAGNIVTTTAGLSL